MRNQSTLDRGLCVGNGICIPAADNKKGGTDLLAADESRMKAPPHDYSYYDHDLRSTSPA